jgi:eukaryotic-like serine/threonine-protein kinase
VGEPPHSDPDASRWRRVRELFDEVADLEADVRRARLHAACPDDEALRLEVEALIRHDGTPDHLFQLAVAVAAHEAVAYDVQDRDLPIPSIIGHYRVLEKVGEGGMGEVYLAEDTTLGRRVALKLPAGVLAADAEARGRLLREARAAATLNHPHVCVVHEVGEAPDGRPFIAMEYLDGETLAARIARGPLPAGEVITLGIEAAGALAEAHALGVVHRDLKPSNIVLTSHGSKLLDFGLASLAREVATEASGHGEGFMGTIRYMSPEQARGTSIDGRSDIFSLGVVLYEAATGRRPFEGDTPRAVREATLHGTPVPPAQIADGLPEGFDAVVARALAKTADERYHNAAELGADLGRLLGVRPGGAWRAWAAGAAALAVVGTLAVIGGRQTPMPTGRAPTPTTVLVGEFANTTGDAAFETLRQALVIQLQQTPFLRVFPEIGVRETLRQMERSPSEPLTPVVTQEIARRRGLHARVAGSIARTGDRYVVRLVATSGASGALIARAEAEADSRTGVLSSLDGAVVQLRQRLGESARSLQQFSTPLEQATTASLDALRAYGVGMQQADRGEYALAMSLFQRAVDIDPDFALAHQALASQSLNAGYMAGAVSAATRAYELRDRVTEQEHHRIVSFYHLSVTGDLDQGIENARRWQQTYPGDWRPHHALANLYHSAGRHEEAVGAARSAVRLNPDSASAYSNLGGALFALDRFGEAADVYREAMARGFDAPEYHAYLWRIAYYTGDAEAMARHLEWAASSATWARHMPALAAALQGRWREAREVSARSVAFFEARHMTGLTALAARYDAVSAALFGDCAVTGREAARVRNLTDIGEERAKAALALAICGEWEEAERLAGEIGIGYPHDTTIGRVWLPLIDAAVDIGRGDTAAAIETIDAVTPHHGTGEPWPAYLRGLAWLRAGDGAAARADFEAIIAHRGRSLWVPLVPLAHLGRARAATMAGDVATASRAYADLFELWPDADADLPVLAAARRELAHHQAPGR